LRQEKIKLNILIAIESFFDGGAEMFAIRLANELSLTQNVYFIELYPNLTKEKRQLSLLDLNRIVLIQPGQNLSGKLLSKNLSTTNSNKTTRKIRSYYKFFKTKQVLEFIKKNKITIVNSHSWDSDVYFAELKKKIQFHLISYFHGHYGLLAEKRENFESVTRRALKLVDKIIYTSPEQQQTLNEFEVPCNKRYKIFYGVSMSLSEKVTDYERGNLLNLVMVARGIKEKGWEEAILSVLHLLQRYPGLIRLTLVGEGNYLDELKIKYNNPAIIFLGYKNNVVDIIRAAHIGLLPTYFVAESLPNTVIEYLFCGKPVITTDVGAIREMISSNQELAGTCISLRNGNADAEYLAAAIENYITYPLLVEQHSSIALKAAQKFTMETCIENYLNVFQNIS
jgi:glycosyltransferase involved in cell wall biosynthesis